MNSMHTPMSAPSRPYTLLTLARLRICRVTIVTLIEVIHRAYSGVRDVLSQRFFMAFTVMCMAMLSRFHSELVAADELLTTLTERLASLVPYCAPSTPSPALASLLETLEPIAATAPPPRIAPRTPTIAKKSLSAASTPTRPASAALDLGGAQCCNLACVSSVVCAPQCVERVLCAVCMLFAVYCCCVLCAIVCYVLCVPHPR